LLRITEPARPEAHLSLVDRVIREMLEDRSLGLDVMVTFNQRDFADVCERRRIEILGG
jgi:hypothetical protein